MQYYPIILIRGFDPSGASPNDPFYGFNEGTVYPDSVNHSRMKDETWRLARRVRTRDHAIRDERWEKGYMWGVDFNLIVERK